MVLIGFLPSSSTLSLQSHPFLPAPGASVSWSIHLVRSVSCCPLGLLRVVEPTERSRQASRAQGDVAENKIHTVPGLGPAWHRSSCHTERALWAPRACRRPLWFLNLFGAVRHPPTSSLSPLPPFLPVQQFLLPRNRPLRSRNTECSFSLHAFEVTPLGASDWLISSQPGNFTASFPDHPIPGFVSSPLCCCTPLSVLCTYPQ